MFKSLSFELSEILNDNHINAEIHGREKTPFSIWRKVQKKRISLEQISDIIGFRVILNNITDCYKALGIFHKRWNCIPGKFKDYISSPKINDYQSLHTAVIGPNRRPIEIQLRTKQMHEYAERGIASHWKYKSSEKFNSLTFFDFSIDDLILNKTSFSFIAFFSPVLIILSNLSMLTFFFSVNSEIIGVI